MMTFERITPCETVITGEIERCFHGGYRVVDDRVLQRRAERIGCGVGIDRIGMTAQQPVVGRKQNVDAAHRFLNARHACERCATERARLALLQELHQPVTGGPRGAVVDRADHAEVPRHHKRIALHAEAGRFQRDHVVKWNHGILQHYIMARRGAHPNRVPCLDNPHTGRIERHQKVT